MSSLDSEAEGNEEDIEDSPEAEAEERVPLTLTVKIDAPSACQRHVTVTIPREDIDRYLDKAFAELVPTATVPGFRAGRAPRKLVEHRFRKDVADQVKSSLLVDSLSQITEDNKLSAISEPSFDAGAVELPETGPLTYEFDLEVRPEFDVPNWKGLTVERPVRDISSQEIDQQLQKLLARRGKLVPFDGPAAAGDSVSAKISVLEGEHVVSELPEQIIRLAAVLSFRDARIDKFGSALAGVRAGETRSLPITISEGAADEKFRGRQLTAKFEVLDVKKLELPELTPELLEAIGGFDSVGDLRDKLQDELTRQTTYHQQQRARQQITALLTAAANWDLPPGLLQRQSRRELERAKLELRRGGFSDQQIQAHENQLRQNTEVNTARALKEHFILERIAEDEKIEDVESDYDDEIRLIAAQSGESVRRVRAQLEHRDLMDVLRNQIIERKTIERVLEHAKFKDVAFVAEGPDVEALDQSAAGGQDEPEIPEAKQAGEAEPLRAAEHRE